MILYMTWFSERGRELAARITELSLSVSYGFWQSRYGGHPAVSKIQICLLYTSPSPRDRTRSRMPSSA